MILVIVLSLSPLETGNTLSLSPFFLSPSPCPSVPLSFPLSLSIFISVFFVYLYLSLPLPWSVCLKAPQCCWPIQRTNVCYTDFFPTYFPFSISLTDSDLYYCFSSTCFGFSLLSFFWFLSFSSVQLLSRVWLLETPWTAACQSSLYITNSQSPLKRSSIQLVMPSNHLILCRPLLLLPSIFPSIRVFSNESTSGGQSIEVSTSTSVLPMNTQDWSPLGQTGWISLQSKGLSRVFSNTTVQEHQFFGTQLSLSSKSHIHTWPLENP